MFDNKVILILSIYISVCLYVYIYVSLVLNEISQDKSVCLWTEPSEVLPCLCSNRRKPVVDPNTSILSCYLYGLRLDSTSSDTSKDPSSEAITATAAAAAAAAINTDESNESSHTSSHKILFPNISHESDTSVLGKIEPPFYFGIDCRTEEEKILGRYTVYITIISIILIFILFLYLF